MNSSIKFISDDLAKMKILISKFGFAINTLTGTDRLNEK
jgi:hypothetical protein